MCITDRTISQILMCAIRPTYVENFYLRLFYFRKILDALFFCKWNRKLWCGIYTPNSLLSRVSSKLFRTSNSQALQKKKCSFGTQHFVQITAHSKFKIGLKKTLYAGIFLFFGSAIFEINRSQHVNG